MFAKRQRLAILAGALALGAAGYLVLFVQTPPGPRSLTGFDPDQIADFELRMWRAYYEKRNAALFGLLVAMLREQYRYPWSKAAKNAFHFARAAARFGNMRSGYESVLPDLEAGYAVIRGWTAASFDADDVARAELAWWVARRDPEMDSAENVGRLIGEEYATMYAVRGPEIARAGALRAQAAALRDAGGVQADWSTIASMLRESYRALSAGLNGRP